MPGILEKIRSKRRGRQTIDLRNSVLEITSLEIRSSQGVDVTPTCIFTNLVDKIEKIDTEDEALRQVDHLRHAEVLSAFELGGILLRIKSECWHKDHETFDDLCKTRFKMSKRRVNYFIQIYEWILDAELTSSELEGLPWTKLRILASKVKPAESIEWVKKAQGMSVRELGMMLPSNPSTSRTNQTVSGAVTINCTNNVSIKAAEENEKREMNELVIKWMREEGPEVVLRTFEKTFPDFHLSSISNG